MTLRKAILLLLIMLTWWLVLTRLLTDNLGSEIRFFNDYSDRYLYEQEGLWLSHGQVPYSQSFSEYPQVAVTLFAMPHLILAWIKPQSRWLDYAAVFSFLTLLFSFLAILVLYQLLPQHKNRALLLLLPASLYFTFNRYDILPSLLGLVSLWLLSRQRWAPAALALAVGVLTKWYLILLLPIYLVYYYTLYKRIARSMILAFGLTSLAILLPTLLLGGVQAVLMPYQWHSTTDMNSESMAYLLDLLVHGLFGGSLANPQAFAVLLALQFAVIPLCLSSKIDSFGKVVEWSALSILVFMLFAKFYSPQWILWVSPLWILRSEKTSDLLWLAAFDLASLLHFPILYDTFGPASAPLTLIVLVRTLIMISLIAMLVRRLAPDHWLLAAVHHRHTAALSR